MTKHDRKNPFLSKIKEEYCISENSGKETNHYVFDIERSGLRYKPGDSLGVFPENDPELISLTINKLGFYGNEDVEVKGVGKIELRDALKTELTIHRAGRKFVVAVVGKLPEGDEKNKLNELLEDRDKLEEYLNVRDCVDIINENPDVVFEAQEFVDTLQNITPRLYSISSSPKVHGDEVHTTIAVVRYENFERKRSGLTTGYLADRMQVKETEIPVYIQATKEFILPKDGSKDVIMVGPGTGIAPFRAFIEERERTHSTGKNWLFFGDWYEESTFFYKDEWKEFMKRGSLNKLTTAFSRDQKKKVYVQHRIEQHSKEIWKWIKKGAYFYVCGDKEYMAKDVHETLIKIVEKEGKMNREKAEEYVNKTLMKEEKRYLRDVY
ncbi:MAG: hypothetical protein BEU04_03675 [Marine Group III euryarchaeote CG-Bathy1]|uniref:FAD-binding FR-type domain-containing protein n=1 Tax=Marine Group III euryarchaeote CG-Bathy1 TaxID=1889001 RepID=A0A1J5TBS5_9ARCH|nr:MAG: hypothetical protein BEU04_03675 [Marine Group III euryarchaeote CG-Bathy1]